MKTATSIYEKLIKRLQQDFSYQSDQILIIISANEQALFLFQNNQLIKNYKISTAEAGLGNQQGSFQTPLGIHQISEKIGHNAELGSIFKGRKNTFELANILTDSQQQSDADNITTRILWLTGLEEGVNKGGDVDSHSRYIYIHGTDEEGCLGTPVSHGCIRMNNQEIIDLFDRVSIATLVVIVK